ncbi:MAG: hypothetical protein AAFR74_08960 [Pseudomonadota bacterium]
MKKLGAALPLVFAVAACAGGRVSEPVALSRDFDDKLGCIHLQAEYDNGIYRLGELQEESDAKLGTNLGLMLMNPIAGVIFLDFSDTQKVEAQAISDRADRLIQIMEAKACSDIPEPLNLEFGKPPAGEE